MNKVARILNSLLLAAFVATIAVSGMTHDAPVAGWYGSAVEGQATADEKPVNLPEFTKADAKKYTNCVELVEGAVSDILLVVDQWNERHVMSFDEAWKRGKTGTEHDNVWTIGTCSSM